MTLSNISQNQPKLEKMIRSATQNAVRQYSQSYFKQRLLIERRRTERWDTKTSILLVKIQGLTEAKKQPTGPGGRFYDFLDELAPKIRISDVVCWYETRMIAFLLPDTDYSGAQIFFDRMRREIIELAPKYLTEKNLTESDLEVEILTYPEKAPKAASENRTESPVTGNRRQADQPIAPHFKENLNLGMYSFNGFSLALPFVETIFWNEAAFANFSLTIQKMLKRLVDILGSFFGLMLLSPLLLLISILVKINSPGPVFFKQERVGFKGKRFHFLKFRSMVCNCDDKIHVKYVTALIQGNTQQINNGSPTDPLYKITEDPRITRVGKFLRKYSLDELPQLWNVLKGEMSLVGPRPPIPYEVNIYKNWHYRRLTAIKPGITGLWQVFGRNKTSFDDMVRLDIQYINGWSLWLDFKILLKTFTVLHQGK
jgi:lipopolysaccharide/colanic/teichoic acid biosynthesis glycosyltransferase